jgi:SAM-dependent methyltransferase
MYRNYAWVTGTSKVSRDYYRGLADRIVEHEALPLLQAETPRGVNPCFSTRVLDIASNDGTLLQAFMERGCYALGVDPAVNVVAESRKKGHRVISDFWSGVLAENLMPFDIITACNVFAHGADPYHFLLACKNALREEGSIWIQTSHVDFIGKSEFETVYHEHHSFFNTMSMQALCERVGVKLTGVYFTPLDGKSYLFRIAKTDKEERYDSVRALEDSYHLFNGITYHSYQEKANKTLEKLKELLNRSPKTILFGAPARATVLMNACGYRVSTCPVSYAVDDNPLKQGKFIPGTAIRIRGIEELKKEESPTIVVMAWNFIDSIRPRILEICPSANIVTYL